MPVLACQALCLIWESLSLRHLASGCGRLLGHPRKTRQHKREHYSGKVAGGNTKFDPTTRHLYSRFFGASVCLYY